MTQRWTWTCIAYYDGNKSLRKKEGDNEPVKSYKQK